MEISLCNLFYIKKPYQKTMFSFELLSFRKQSSLKASSVFSLHFDGEDLFLELLFVSFIFRFNG